MGQIAPHAAPRGRIRPSTIVDDRRPLGLSTRCGDRPFTTDMTGPDAPRSAHGSLRPIAWIHLATTAFAIAATACVLWLAPLGPRDPATRAAILAVVLAAGIAGLVPTLRVVRRELGQLPAASSLQNSESV